MGNVSLLVALALQSLWMYKVVSLEAVLSAEKWGTAVPLLSSPGVFHLAYWSWTRYCMKSRSRREAALYYVILFIFFQIFFDVDHF